MKIAVSFRAASLCLMCTLISAPACKPPASHSTAKDIVGTNASGSHSSLTLVPVRNLTQAPLPNPQGAVRSVQLAVYWFQWHFFAMSECSTLSGEGAPAAERLTKLIDQLSINDYLLIDANRNLATFADAKQRPLTSQDDNDILTRYGKPVGNGFVEVPCSVVGDRLVSWNVMEKLGMDIFNNMPATQPTGAAAGTAKSSFLAKQMLHLALRGNYSTVPAKQNTAKFSFIPVMVAEERLVDLTNFQLGSALTDGDLHYNPCVTATGATAQYGYLQSWKAANFGCVATSDPDVKEYAPKGGDDSWVAGARAAQNCSWPTTQDTLGYEGIKYIWNCQIDAVSTWLDQQPTSATPHLQQLWGMITATNPWTQSGGDLGTFLTTGKAGSGFDYTSYFAATSAGLRLADVQSTSGGGSTISVCPTQKGGATPAPSSRPAQQLGFEAALCQLTHPAGVPAGATAPRAYAPVGNAYSAITPIGAGVPVSPLNSVYPGGSVINAGQINPYQYAAGYPAYPLGNYPVSGVDPNSVYGAGYGTGVYGTGVYGTGAYGSGVYGAGAPGTVGAPGTAGGLQQIGTLTNGQPIYTAAPTNRALAVGSGGEGNVDATTGGGTTGDTSGSGSTTGATTTGNSPSVTGTTGGTSSTGGSTTGGVTGSDTTGGANGGSATTGGGDNTTTGGFSTTGGGDNTSGGGYNATGGGYNTNGGGYSTTGGGDTTGGDVGGDTTGGDDD